MTVDRVLEECRTLYSDCSRSGNHDRVVNLYNSISPLPRGYKLQKSDAWCAAFVSAVGKAANAGSAWVYECSAPQMLSEWKRRGKVYKDFDKMRPGDIVFYSWYKNGNADHVGIVTAVNTVSGGTMVTVIEGNKSGRCDYRAFRLPYSYLLAYARPVYEEVVKMDTPSNWAAAAWKKATQSGVFDGTNPTGPITREQVAVVLDRLGLLK